MPKIFTKIKTFFITFRDAYREYKLAITTLAVLGFLSALMEGIGINALIPMFSFITNKSSTGDDFISKTIEKFFTTLNIDFSLKYLLVFIALLFIFKAILLVLSELIRVKIVAGYEEKMRNKLFKKFLNANWSYLLKQKLGFLHTVITINIQNSAKILSYISSFIIIFSSLIIYILIAINIDLRITIFTLILGSFLFLIFIPIVKKIRDKHFILEKLNRTIAHHVNENIFGMKTIKVMHSIKYILEDARKNFYDLRKNTVYVSVVQAIVPSIMQPVSIIFVLIIFAYSYKTQTFNLPAFVAIIYLIKQIFSYIEVLQKKIFAFNAAIPFFNGVREYEMQSEENIEKNIGTRDFSFNKDLEINNVGFSYNSDKRVLSDVKFTINKGEMVGLIGPSGAGKTTIVDLVLRLFTPESGKILLDGVNIDDISMKEWRKNIGYVSQDIFLMNDSIVNNIKFYDDEITEEEIKEATKMANIYDFIMSLPEKFNTVIGERGIELSAGQRQRIVIARVIARKPRILVLDEATSALDNESEVKIQKVIENLKGKITVFVIAHRLSTIINCDQLLVLEGGKIIEKGKPKELLEDKKSYFYKVYNIRNNNK